MASDVLQKCMRLPAHVFEMNNLSSIFEEGSKVVHHCRIFILTIEPHIWLLFLDLQTD